MRAVLMLSHASRAVSLPRSVEAISAGTALVSASNAIMFSWGSTPPGSMAVQRRRTFILIFINWD